jgi:hypothetical protein
MTATEPPPAGPPAGLDRRDLIRLGGLIAVLLLIVGIVLLTSGGGSSERSTGQMQGVLTEVSRTRLVLQPNNGGGPQEFDVRPEDAQRLDFFHLDQHASDALPSIVYYEQVGDTRFATRVEDAPTPAG